jgi:hypothetical protein
MFFAAGSRSASDDARLVQTVLKANTARRHSPSIIRQKIRMTRANLIDLAQRARQMLA